MRNKHFPPFASWRPGTTFRNNAGTLCHYVGIYNGKNRVHTWKWWDKYSARWVYVTDTEERFSIDLCFYEFVKL